MNFLSQFDFLLNSFRAITWQQLLMFAVGALLILLALKWDFEPALLMPMGFGAIMANIPLVFDTGGMLPLLALYEAGIKSELFPLLIFVAVGAMIDFGPLLTNPKMLLFGGAAQFGIFFTMSMAAYRNHRCSGRTYIYLCGDTVCRAFVGTYIGCRIFIHVAGTDYSASGY